MYHAYIYIDQLSVLRIMKCTGCTKYTLYTSGLVNFIKLPLSFQTQTEPSADCPLQSILIAFKSLLSPYVDVN